MHFPHKCFQIIQCPFLLLHYIHHMVHLFIQVMSFQWRYHHQLVKFLWHLQFRLDHKDPVQALVGMLQSWSQDEGAKELACTSHVHQLLSKLPAHHVSSFARHARTVNLNVSYNLVDFAKWLEKEADFRF